VCWSINQFISFFFPLFSTYFKAPRIFSNISLFMAAATPFSLSLPLFSLSLSLSPSHHHHHRHIYRTPNENHRSHMWRSLVVRREKIHLPPHLQFNSYRNLKLRGGRLKDLSSYSSSHYTSHPACMFRYTFLFLSLFVQVLA
jgi:hypothetical protein